MCQIICVFNGGSEGRPGERGWDTLHFGLVNFPPFGQGEILGADIPVFFISTSTVVPSVRRLSTNSIAVCSSSVLIAVFFGNLPVTVFLGPAQEDDVLNLLIS